jgi:hypothetical protein
MYRGTGQCKWIRIELLNEELELEIDQGPDDDRQREAQDHDLDVRGSPDDPPARDPGRCVQRGDAARVTRPREAREDMGHDEQARQDPQEPEVAQGGRPRGDRPTDDSAQKPATGRSGTGDARRESQASSAKSQKCGRSIMAWLPVHR